MHDNLLGLGVMGVHHIMIIIIKILKKKTYFSRPDSPFPSQSNNTLGGNRRNHLAMLDLAVALPGISPPRRLCNFYVQLKWRHTKRWQVFRRSKSLKTDANTHSKTERRPFWNQRNADQLTRCQIYTLFPSGCRGLATFARQIHVPSMFWLGFSWSDGRVKFDHSPKRTDEHWYALVKIHHGYPCTNKLCFENTRKSVSHDVTAYITERVSTILAQMCFHRCPF